jgi:hypothetical protein
VFVPDASDTRTAPRNDNEAAITIVLPIDIQPPERVPHPELRRGLPSLDESLQRKRPPKPATFVLVTEI